jgi:hypothetical protein
MVQVVVRGMMVMERGRRLLQHPWHALRVMPVSQLQLMQHQ